MTNSKHCNIRSLSQARIFLKLLRFLEYDASTLLNSDKKTSKDLATSIFRVQAIQEHSYLNVQTPKMEAASLSETSLFTNRHGVISHKAPTCINTAKKTANPVE